MAPGGSSSSSSSGSNNRRRALTPNPPLDLPTETLARIRADPNLHYDIDYPPRIFHLKVPAAGESGSWEQTYLHQPVSLPRVRASWVTASGSGSAAAADCFALFRGSETFGVRSDRDMLLLDDAFMLDGSSTTTTTTASSSRGHGIIAEMMAAPQRANVRVVAITIGACDVATLATLARTFPALRRVVVAVPAVAARPDAARAHASREFARWGDFAGVVEAELRTARAAGKSKGPGPLAEYGAEQGLLAEAEGDGKGMGIAGRAGLAEEIEEEFAEKHGMEVRVEVSMLFYYVDAWARAAEAGWDVPESVSACHLDLRRWLH